MIYREARTLLRGRNGAWAGVGEKKQAQAGETGRQVCVGVVCVCGVWCACEGVAVRGVVCKKQK